MKTKRIDFSKLLFALFCFLVLTAFGAAAQAANVTGTISGGLGVYTTGTIYIGAFPDENSTVALAYTSIPSLTPGTYSIDCSGVTNGMSLWIKARWDANGNIAKDGGDVVGGYPSNPIVFNSSSGNSGIDITLNNVLISGQIQIGTSGYTSGNIYIGAHQSSDVLVAGTMVSALGEYVFGVPGSYLNQQLEVKAFWDKDGVGGNQPTRGDWGGLYVSNPITLQVGTNSTIDIPLTHEFFTITGTVTRAEGGALIPNLEINVRSDNPCDSGMPVAWALTDGIGNYTLTLPGDFTYFLFANPALMTPSQDLAPEWYTSTGGTIYCAEAEGIYLTESTDGKNFALLNGGTISGTVKNNVGALLSGVTVVTWNDALAQGWQQKATDANGNFTFSDLSQGPWEIRVQLDPIATNYVDYVREDWLNLSENRNIGTITLQQGALVTGTLKDSAGNPIPYLDYWYGGKFEIGWSRAAGDGTFAFRLPLGTYYLNLDPEDSGYTMLPKEITVTDVGTPIPLGDLTAYDNATGDHISGTVTVSAEKTGQFQVVAFLSSQPLTPDNFGAVAVLGAGQPEFPGDGSYSLFVPPDQTVNVVLALFVENEKSLESMTVVSTPIVGLNLSLDPDGIVNGQDFVYNNAVYTLDGYVKSSSAPAPPFKADVLLYKQPGDIFAGFAESDETGYYKFYNVPGGDYKIAVTHPSYPDETPWSSLFTVSAVMRAPDIFIGGLPPKNEIAGDFGSIGAGAGVYIFKNGSWGTLISPANPDSLVPFDVDGDGQEELLGDFGGLGVYYYIYVTQQWVKISDSNPDSLVPIDVDGDSVDEIAGDFGSIGAGAGVYIFKNGSWGTLISPTNPDSLVPFDVDGDGQEELLGDFGTLGVYYYVYATQQWVKISDSNPDSLVPIDVDGDSVDEIAGDFGSIGAGAGVYIFKNGAWGIPVSSANPDSLRAFDVDSDGSSELLGDFGNLGAYYFNYNSQQWTLISSANADSLVPINVGN
jgi:hypothetical protein